MDRRKIKKLWKRECAPITPARRRGARQYHRNGSNRAMHTAVFTLGHKSYLAFEMSIWMEQQS